MKKLLPYLPPLAVLLVILAFSLWNSGNMAQQTDRWREQLQQADAMAQAGDWTGAVDALTKSYDDWNSHQTYLHIVTEHQAVDDAGAMFRRAMSFAATRETSEFRAEISDLRDQIRLLSEMEQFSLKNVL